MDNYRKIIEVAIKLMGEKGYNGTSLQMIAEKVGIKKASIFHHFDKKEAILLAILQEVLPSVTYDLMLLENDSTISGSEKLKKFFRMHLEQVAKHGDVLKVYLTEFRNLSKRNREKYLDSRRLYTDLVTQIVREACKEDQNLFKGLDPSIVANGILGMCNWAVIWFKSDGTMSIEEISEQLFQLTKFSCLPEES
jgi:AcrR family transcriptional regulator